MKDFVGAKHFLNQNCLIRRLALFQRCLREDKIGKMLRPYLSRMRGDVNVAPVILNEVNALRLVIRNENLIAVRATRPFAL